MAVHNKPRQSRSEVRSTSAIYATTAFPTPPQIKERTSTNDQFIQNNRHSNPEKGAGRQLKSGGMWVYDNEIDTFSETVEDGGLIELHDFDDYFMGIGFVNRRSKITVRMLSRHEGEINEEFIKQRVKDAVSYRMDTVDTSSCRLIFGEADFLPGIVIDKFSDVLVVESLALGIDRFKQLIVDDLKEILKEYGMPIRGVYERSDAKVRQLEGMERVKGFIGEEFDTKVMITEMVLNIM